MTNREWLSKMSDDELADWLCKQMFLDYDADDFINVARFHTVRNFLKMERNIRRKKHKIQNQQSTDKDVTRGKTS